MSLLLVCFSAWAQTEPEEIDAATGRKIKWLEREEIIFDGVSLQGELVGPDGKMHQEHKRPVFNPLIKLRNDWNPEMRASVDEVK
jgi:hypothetical protein